MEEEQYVGGGAGGGAKAGLMAVGVQDVDLPAHVGGGVGVVVHHVGPGQVRRHLRINNKLFKSVKEKKRKNGWFRLFLDRQGRTSLKQAPKFV